MGRPKGSKNKSKDSKNSNYIDNAELEAELIKCKESGTISDRLLQMFQLLITRVNRINKYKHPDEYQDYEQEAMLGLLKMYDKFDPSKGSAFSLFTNQVAWGLAAGYNKLHPKKTKGTIRLSYQDKDNGTVNDMYTF